jgi:hypothetical protein
MLKYPQHVAAEYNSPDILVILQFFVNPFENLPFFAEGFIEGGLVHPCFFGCYTHQCADNLIKQ